MSGFIARWLINIVALWFTSWIIRGIEVEGIVPLFVASLVLGILNAVLRPIVLFLTLPINFLTLGLFTFVINALMLWITSQVVSGFYVSGFLAAFIGAILLSIVSTILNYFLSDRGKFEVIVIKK
jgi:putative membrane protein